MGSPFASSVIRLLAVCSSSSGGPVLMRMVPNRVMNMQVMAMISGAFWNAFSLLSNSHVP